MTRKKLEHTELMQATEKLLLEQGYGGFNFSALSTLLKIGRSTLYEYYASKDELIATYMDDLMDHYMDDLAKIVARKDAKEKLVLLIELMITYAHIHGIIKMIPLLQNESKKVQQVKKTFVEDHLLIIEQIRTIIEDGKRENVIREEIPTDILVNMLFQTINKPELLPMDNEAWAQWIWEIIYVGIGPQQ
ncbi:MAG TPA: TetR/AcrR family transcriptional regulator [Bacillota bacterium]